MKNLDVIVVLAGIVLMVFMAIWEMKIFAP